MEALIKAVKSLLSDIEAMEYRPDWYGTFSEFQEEDDASFITSMTVEWPNLAISAAEVKKILAEIPSST